MIKHWKKGYESVSGILRKMGEKKLVLQIVAPTNAARTYNHLKSSGEVWKLVISENILKGVA